MKPIFTKLPPIASLPETPNPVTLQVSDEFVRQLLDKCGKAIRLCHGRRLGLGDLSAKAQLKVSSLAFL